jgi:hypothetical protein
MEALQRPVRHNITRFNENHVTGSNTKTEVLTYVTLGRTKAATTRSTKMIARKSSVCWYLRSTLISDWTLGVTFPSATAAPIITSTCSPPETTTPQNWTRREVYQHHFPSKLLKTAEVVKSRAELRSAQRFTLVGHVPGHIMNIAYERYTSLSFPLCQW